MTSAFESEVYAERQRLPGVSISIPKLMQTLLWVTGADKAGCDPVSITLEYRPDVETSSWWTVKWGGTASVSATTLELALFRAAVLARKDDERAKKYADKPQAGSKTRSY